MIKDNYLILQYLFELVFSDILKIFIIKGYFSVIKYAVLETDTITL